MPRLFYGVFWPQIFRLLYQNGKHMAIGALHSVWNLVQGNVYGIKVSGMETSCTVFSASLTGGREIFHGGSFGLEGGLAVTIVLLAGIAVLLFQLNKNKKDLAVEN